MEKTQAELFAAVICRAIDYFHVRSSAERIGYGPEQVERLAAGEFHLAEAIAKIDDTQASAC